MKKILFVHHGLSKGGAPRSLAFLIDQMDKKEFEPIVVCVQDKENIAKFEAVGAKVIFQPRISAFHGSTVSPITLKRILLNLKSVLPTFWQSRKVIKEIKPDLVHLNSTCLFVVAAGIRSINKNIPVTCHVREPLLNSIWGKIIKKYSNKFVSEFIAIDRYDAESLDDGSSKINIVYNFVNFDMYHSHIQSDVLRKKFNITKNDVIFLYLARVAEANGAYEMLRYLRKQNLEEHKMHFVIVGFKGNDAYTQKVRKLCDSMDHVHTIDFIDDVPEVIADADVMVVPFTKPHFARAIIEAAAMAVPSIASDIGGPNELIQHNETGYLYDIDNMTGFWDYCVKLAVDQELRIDIGSKAEEFAKNNFDAVKNAEKTFDIFRKHIS